MENKKTVLQYGSDKTPFGKAVTKQPVEGSHKRKSYSDINDEDTIQSENPPSIESKAPTPPTFLTPPKTVLPSVTIKEDGEINWIHTSKSRLEIISRIGEGGAGEVLKAIDQDIGRTVAIKKIRSEIVSPHMIMRFVEEIKTVGNLEHPNIIPIHDVGVDESGDYYFVMKYVEGETLSDIIERLKAKDKTTLKKYTFERRMEIFRDLLEAMAYTHDRGIIHRDIKPENIMVGPFGEVLLMDWGIAKNLNDERESIIKNNKNIEDGRVSGDDRFWRTVDGSLIGTPAYMSPEQSRGEKLDERTDIYSLSVLLHEFLTLTHYLDGIDELNDVLQGVSTKEPGILSYEMGDTPVPMDLVWFVRKGMNKDKSRRYQSINEMINRLKQRADGVVPVECPVTFTKRINGAIMSFTDRHPMIGLMGIVVFTILGVLGAFSVIKNLIN